MILKFEPADVLPMNLIVARLTDNPQIREIRGITGRSLVGGDVPTRDRLAVAKMIDSPHEFGSVLLRQAAFLEHSAGLVLNRLPETFKFPIHLGLPGDISFSDDALEQPKGIHLIVVIFSAAVSPKPGAFAIPVLNLIEEGFERGKNSETILIWQEKDGGPESLIVEEGDNVLEPIVRSMKRTLNIAMD